MLLPQLSVACTWAHMRATYLTGKQVHTLAQTYTLIIIERWKFSKMIACNLGSTMS